MPSHIIEHLRRRTQTAVMGSISMYCTIHHLLVWVVWVGMWLRCFNYLTQICRRPGTLHSFSPSRADWCVCVFIYLFIYLFIYWFIYLLTYLFIYLLYFTYHGTYKNGNLQLLSPNLSYSSVVRELDLHLQVLCSNPTGIKWFYLFLFIYLFLFLHIFWID